MHYGIDFWIRERRLALRRVALHTLAIETCLLAAVLALQIPAIRSWVRPARRIVRFGYEGPDRYVERIELQTQERDQLPMVDLGHVAQTPSRQGGGGLDPARATSRKRSTRVSRLPGPGEDDVTRIAEARARMASVPLVQSSELVIESMLTESAESDFDPGQDDTLALLFMCCHPSLTTPSAIALTLRAVGGLTTGEIAKAFFVPEATMAQRISRAKQAIKDSNIPFSLPSGEEREERLDAVMQILYLIFNEGYTSSGGDKLQRIDLSAEAIRLTRALNEVVIDSPEAVELLALMLLTDARSAARSGPAGELIPLDEQDRTL